MSSQRQHISRIVYGDYVVTMDDERHVIENGAVAIDERFIVGVGSRKDIAARYVSQNISEGRNRVVMPGLINGHTHAAMTLLRGYADDIPLMEWLQRYINPIEAKVVDPDFVRVGTTLACLEMLLGGITTFVDMYFFFDSQAEAAHAARMRALISATIIDQPRNDAVDLEDQFRQAEKFVNDWSDPDSTVSGNLGAHAIYTVKGEDLVRLRALADKLNTSIHIHVSESQSELEFSRNSYDTTPISYFEEIDFLNGPTIAAHVVWPTDDEVETLKRRNVGVVHNPSSNSKISSGVAPVAKLVANQINVGLGTDGAVTNNDLNMWEEMRLASFLQKVQTMDPTVMPARHVLQMATVIGARAIGLDDKIGALREGLLADVIQVQINNVHQLPLHDVESNLVYATHASDVVTVFVDGKEVVHEGVSQSIDVDALRRDIDSELTKIRNLS